MNEVTKININIHSNGHVYLTSVDESLLAIKLNTLGDH